jgi:hypothetical protein
MLKKGLIFSIDAMFAIAVAGMMVLACFFYLSQTTTNIHNDQDMYKISSDSLTILEKDGTLAASVATGSPVTISSFLDSLPGQLCGNATIYTSSSAALLSAQRAGCTAGEEPAIAVRSFVTGVSGVYYAKMAVWYR